MNPRLHQVPRLHPNAGMQRVAGRLLAASPDDFFHTFEDEMGQISEVGERIVELSNGSRTIAEIVNVLCQEFDVSEATCAQDAIEFIDRLSERKLLVLSGQASRNACRGSE